MSRVRRLAAPRREPADRGSAIVEFSFLALLLLVPMAYLVLTVFRVQAAAYAATGATREAGRAFVTSTAAAPQGVGATYDDALAAAALAAGDHGVELRGSDLRIECAPDPACPLVPGQRVEVSVELRVPLPLIPRWGGDRLPASVAVSARHVETVDRFRSDG